MKTKVAIISAAYKAGKLTAEVRNNAFAYLARFPDAPASLAVSFAKLHLNK